VNTRQLAYTEVWRVGGWLAGGVQESDARRKRVQRRRLKRAQRAVIRHYNSDATKRMMGGWAWTARLGRLGDRLARCWSAYFEW
jgi:hypothetical protein